MSNPRVDEFVEHVSPVAFEPTLERLVSAIAAAGLILFSRIDHAAGARGGDGDAPVDGAGLRAS